VFDDHRYFDVVVEYAKQSPSDILIRISVHNRGPEAAALHVLPQLWFRNTWRGAIRFTSRADSGARLAVARSELLGTYRLYRDRRALALHRERHQRRPLFGAPERAAVQGRVPRIRRRWQFERRQPERRGTKTAAHHRLEVPSGEVAVGRLRLTIESYRDPFAGFDAVIDDRRREADDFYDRLQQACPPIGGSSSGRRSPG
jgi:hypothetical protein